MIWKETFHDDALDFENCEILDSFSSFSFFPFFFKKRKDKNLETFVEKKIRQIFIREKKTAWLFARNRIRLRIRPESFRVNISFSLVDTVGNSHIRRCTATPAGTLEEPGGAE